jgi:hypothetical protein
MNPEIIIISKKEKHSWKSSVTVCSRRQYLMGNNGGPGENRTGNCLVGRLIDAFWLIDLQRTCGLVVNIPTVNISL